MNNETIEQRTRRLTDLYLSRQKPSNQINRLEHTYKDVSSIVELAIAEEREANAKICDDLELDFNSRDASNLADLYRAEGADGCANAIRQHAAAKAEVSE